ncbi:RMD1 family protein [Tamlana sp. 2_MG-2023]|uniref:RMD1 family protein n=1 Tax=unclassified Tamlana TaxID=2614803 RepID=UPI0026E27481|nr:MULTISPECIES: RMD1 family protein [unclassified Tamlana]MDO6760933.1 RMD1 family protein [Tamlana sp. 2_MG-2023]MDO6791189.1 RMD1 family protein [Tamlana sp. 1_MG-2023]
MYAVVAYQVASAINIKTSKQELPWQLLFQDSDELYYKSSDQKFIYIFQYGMVGFFNLTAAEIEDALSKIKPVCDNYFSEKLSESLEIFIKPGALNVQFDHVVLPELDQEMIRLVMLNTSQSVALSRYSEITEELIIETNNHTSFLEKKGRLNISGNKLKRFIGKILNIKNKISENLYIFDAPEITWENEQLNKLDLDLKRAFDLKDRYRIIHDRIEIIKENLELFKDIMDHKESSRLEWIIIILIVIEVIDMFIIKWSS